jgi:predicted small secreted protein
MKIRAILKETNKDLINMAKVHIVIILCGFLALGGCSNTFDGVGQDLEKAGDWFQKTF